MMFCLFATFGTNMMIFTSILMVTILLAIEATKWIRYIHFNVNSKERNFDGRRQNWSVKCKDKCIGVFQLTIFSHSKTFYCSYILSFHLFQNFLLTTTPQVGKRITPLEEFSELCGKTRTFKS